MNQNVKIAGVLMRDIKSAMKRYFGRLANGVARLDNNSIRVAARVRVGDRIIQSRWHRENQKNVRRANNLIILQAKESSR